MIGGDSFDDADNGDDDGGGGGDNYNGNFWFTNATLYHTSE